MKKLFYLLQVTMLICSCSTNEDPWENGGNMIFPGGITPGTTSGSSSGTLSGLSDLNDFTIDLNTSALAETESVPTSKETDVYYSEYIESNFKGNKATIYTVNFNGSSATVTGDINKDDIIAVNGAHVQINSSIENLVLRLTGSTSDGGIKICSQQKFAMLLDNVTVTNPDGAAINIQKGNCFVVLSGTSTLSDGPTASYLTEGEEDMKAVFFSEDDLRFSAGDQNSIASQKPSATQGTLIVKADNGMGKHGIASDDALFIRPNTNIQITAGSNAGHGLKCNDDLVIMGGVQNISVAAAGKKGMNAEGNICIYGGRCTALTSGGVLVSDGTYTGCAGMKADHTLNICAGEVSLKSTGQGGKGISCDGDINITGGTVKVITTGNVYGTPSSSAGGGMGGWHGWGQGSSGNSDTSCSPKGIRGDCNVNISRGVILVRTTGTYGEGIESKANLNISGGEVAVSAYDDGLNAATAINLTGGKIFSASTGNCDGIDSNGKLTISNAVVIAIASNATSEDALDAEGTVSISNSVVVGLSGGGMAGNQLSGNRISTTVSGNSGSYVALLDGTTPLVVFSLPKQYNNGRMILSAPSLKSGKSYQLTTACSFSGGTQWMNYYSGVTSVSGGSSTTVKF